MENISNLNKSNIIGLVCDTLTTDKGLQYVQIFQVNEKINTIHLRKYKRLNMSQKVHYLKLWKCHEMYTKGSKEERKKKKKKKKKEKTLKFTKLFLTEILKA